MPSGPRARRRVLAMPDRRRRAARRSGRRRRCNRLVGQGTARLGASGSRSRSGRFSKFLSAGSARPCKAASAGMAAAMVLGAALALLRLSRTAPVRWLATTWVEFFRGVPLILLIFFMLLGSAEVRDRHDAVPGARARPRALQRRACSVRSSAPASFRSTAARPRRPTRIGLGVLAGDVPGRHPAGGAAHDPGDRRPADHAAQGHLARLRHHLRGAVAPQPEHRRVLQEPAPGRPSSSRSSTSR